MSASNTLETGILDLIFNNTALANIGDAGGLQPSAAVGNLFIALYTSDPTDADIGTETVYTNYTRVAVIRSVVGWDVVGNNAANAAAVVFPQCGVTGATITHFGILTSLTGGTLLFFGVLSLSLAVANGDSPSFAIGALDVNAD